MLRRHPAEPRGGRAALVTALLSAVLLLPHRAAADAGRAPSFANQRPGVAYAGTAACADCHSDLAESFAAHGMARTFAPIDPDRPLADWTGSQIVVDPKTGLRYQPYRDGDRFFIRESLLDERGREIHSLVREAHYALGSGINDQAYVHEANGFLRMLPLEWYTEEERWDFAPMFEVDNQRFARRINVRCMVCHNAVPEIRSEEAARFALPLPSGVSCERCHGPGALHVEARAAGLEPVAGGIDSTIVNPRHLPPLRQLDICAQCHLQGDAEVLRPGRTQLSFRPGEPLTSHRAVFVSVRPDTQEFGFVRHVERLAQSRCFTASAGRMTCTTCHDPHQTSTGHPDRDWDAACARCHQAADCKLTDMRARADASCVACHMRRSEPHDVMHVTITDHWIRRRIAPPAKHTRAVYRPDSTAAVALFVLPGEEHEPTAEERELLAIGSADLGLGGAAREALIAAASRWGSPHGGLVLPAAARDPELARAAPHLRDPRARRDAALLLASAGDSAAARALLAGAVADAPGDARLAAALVRLELAMGMGEQALARARAAAAADRSDSELAQLAAELEAAAGDPKQAALGYARTVELDPEDAAALRGLGRILLRTGDTSRAATAFVRLAIELPFDAEAHGALGFCMAALNRPQPAADAYRRALALAPESPELHFNLGNALAAIGDSTAAEGAYREAIRLRPDYYQAHGNLGFLLGGRGDTAGARREFERVLEMRPGDAVARRALDELGR